MTPVDQETLAARYLVLKEGTDSPLLVVNHRGGLCRCLEPVEVRYVCGHCRRGRVKPVTGTKCPECGSVVVGFG